MPSQPPFPEDVPTVHRGHLAAVGLPAAYVVRVQSGPDQGARFAIDPSDPGNVLIGTSPVCQIRLNDREVSRRHAALEFQGAELHLIDLQSTNGTTINGVPIVEGIVTGGENIVVGGTSLSIERVTSIREPSWSGSDRFGRVLGSSIAMRRIYPLCERLASSDVPVLVEGETGTGKELLAESLHEASPRAKAPFVVFDCSAISPTLVESHLFGHERGAFTGATNTRKGVFELAHGGTLFIDEIGELELGLQARLLRATERGEVCRVGSERWLKVDVRIMAATRRDLDREVQAGRFRDDLFFRLAVARIELPALRHRHGDITLLARHFWDTLGGAGTPIPFDLFSRFEELPWPGNIRELLNAVSRRITLGDLAEVDGWNRDNSDIARAEQPEDLVEKILALELALPSARQRLVTEFERRYVERVLDRHGGDAGKAAEASGIARRYFNLLRARHRT